VPSGQNPSPDPKQKKAAVIGLLSASPSQAENGLRRSAGGGRGTGIQHSPRSAAYFSAVARKVDLNTARCSRFIEGRSAVPPKIAAVRLQMVTDNKQI
jgi:hypothetical protein